MERDAIDWALAFMQGLSINVKENVQAHLLIELDGNYPEILMLEAERIMHTLEAFEIDDILYAETEDQKKALWKMRRGIGEAVKAHSIYKEEDTVVPRYYLPQLLTGIKEIGRKYGFQSVCYGHAGDGNLHVNIIKGELSDEFWNKTIKSGIREIFELTVSLEGTLSGEHGIGFVQKEFMDIAFPPQHLILLKNLKQLS